METRRAAQKCHSGERKELETMAQREVALMAAQEAGRAEAWNMQVAAETPSRTRWEMRRNWLQLSEPQWWAGQPSLQGAGEGFRVALSRFHFLPSFSLSSGSALGRSERLRRKLPTRIGVGARIGGPARGSGLRWWTRKIR